MFLAMNRFKVVKDAAAEFEDVWRNRDSHLGEMEDLLTSICSGAPKRLTIFCMHPIRCGGPVADFEAWTRSEQFRKVHSRAPSTRPLYLDHPNFEGFVSVQEL